MRETKEEASDDGVVFGCRALHALLRWGPAFVEVADAEDAPGLLHSIIDGPKTDAGCAEACSVFALCMAGRQAVQQRFVVKRGCPATPSPQRTRQ